jgi:outer membrane lipoprotein-sorting protein
MRRLLGMMMLMLFHLIGKSQYPGYTQVNHPENFKKAFATATSGTETIQSDFHQEKTLSLLSEKLKSEGKFWFQKNNRLRMEYISLSPYTLILNSGKIYLKDGTSENRISAGSNKIFQQVNRILLDCVSGNMLSNPEFESRIFENAGSYLIELKPVVKNLKELYKSINIVIDKKDFSAISIGMYELSGDLTVIRFQNKVFNAHISDSVFNIP